MVLNCIIVGCPRCITSDKFSCRHEKPFGTVETRFIKLAFSDLLVVKGLIVQLRLVLPLVDSSKVHSLSTKWSLTPCYKSGWLIIGIAKVSDVCARCTRYRHSYWLYLMSGKFLARSYFGNDKLLYFVSSTDPQQKQSLNIHSSGIERSS